VWERWDDPGDYPNGLAGGPLRSRTFVAEIKGRLVVQFEPKDLAQIEAETLTREVAQDYLADYPQAPLDSEDVKVTKWDVLQVARDEAVLEPADWEDR
jgi:hypothetical protein